MKNIFELPLDGKGLAHDVARSSEDWAYFREYHKKNNPIRYWLTNEFESIFIWPITMRWERVSDWVRYRTYNRYHIVNTGMEPGYVDVTERMLHINFNMLKDFVEIEKAHMWEWSGNPKMEQPGVSYLAWEMGLEEVNDNSQAENAREIYELYDWWTNQRPYRVEDNTEDWEAYRKLSDEIYGDTDEFFLREDKDTSELKFLRKTWLDNSNTIERNNLMEDEKMLIRLVKIRSSLWT